MPETEQGDDYVKLALCGDVMTGRGVDQILAHPGGPRLHERYVKSALDYVALAEKVSGPIPRKASPDYIWGDALEKIRAPDAFIINLETAVTSSDSFEPKGINYRMNPANVDCLVAGGVDCCVLANNHVLDWGMAGLKDTMQALSQAAIATAGAGLTEEEAGAPAIIEVKDKGRILVFAFALTSSGVPLDWAAGPDKPGVNLLPDISESAAKRLAEKIRAYRKPGDVLIASVHWGANWGYEIAENERRFARTLIDEAGVSVIYGHSSHHPKAAETYQDHLILYGCGDFLNDYEGIGGHDQYRSDLALLYNVGIDRQTDALDILELQPFHVRKFRLNRPTDEDKTWLLERLRREYARFDLALTPSGRGGFIVAPPVDRG